MKVLCNKILVILMAAVLIAALSVSAVPAEEAVEEGLFLEESTGADFIEPETDVAEEMDVAEETEVTEEIDVSEETEEMVQVTELPEDLPEETGSVEEEFCEAEASETIVAETDEEGIEVTAVSVIPETDEVENEDAEAETVVVSDLVDEEEASDDIPEHQTVLSEQLEEPESEQTMGLEEEIPETDLPDLAEMQTQEISESLYGPEEDYVILEETLEELVLSDTFTDFAEGYEAVNMASEELLENYVSEEALYAGTYNGSKLTDLSIIVYNGLKNLVAKVAEGSISSSKYNLTLDTTDLSGYKWKATDLGVTTLFGDSSRSTINKTAAENAINSIYNPTLAVKSLIRDCPYEMYWFGNTYSMNKTYTPVVSYDPVVKDYVMTFKNVVLSINLKVSDDYAGSDSYTTNQTKIANAKKAVLNAQKIVSDAEGKSDLDKLDYFRQAICNLVSYNKSVTSANYPGGYGDPWQMIYVFDGDTDTNVVCEGYAKAFQYLCDLSRFSTSDFTIYSVSGTFKAGNGTEGGHLWNIVHMNGVNYMVDLTNSDDTIPTTKLYMVHPESGSVDSGYVFKSGSTTYTYKYYSDSRLLYSDEELSYDIVHDWDEGKVVAQATCTTAGSKLYTCKLCNATKSETIPATGHKAVVYSKAVEPTLFNSGMTEGTSCSVCRSVINAPQTVARQELSRQLFAGMKGEDVRQVQQRLSDLGYSIYVDGDYGQSTAAVVAKFQTDHGLYADGSVGNLTLNALRNAYAATNSIDNGNLTRELRAGMTGNDVRVVQQKLATLGYSITVDGEYGNYTKSVVEHFQRLCGLYVDGIVGTTTMAYLNYWANVYSNYRSGNSGSGNSNSGNSGSGNSGSGNSGSSTSSTGDITLTRNLSRGMSGSDVKAVQQKLSDLGFNIYVDGDFGAKTEEVVKAFQKANGLYVDGLVGAQTVKILNSKTRGAGTSSGKITLTRELRRGMSGQDVLAVQQKLQDLGYTIYVDGDFGAKTEEVVKAFQRANGLYVDGLVGNVTISVLNSR